MGVIINMTGVKDYTPYQAGNSDLFPFDGTTYGSITKIWTAKSSKGNECVVFEALGGEAPATGKRAVKWIPYSGTRTDGKPNLFSLVEAIVAVMTHNGYTAEAAETWCKSFEGKGFDTDEIARLFTGKLIGFTVEAQRFDRDDGTVAWSSSVNYVKKSEYDSKRSFGHPHIPLPPAAEAWTRGERQQVQAQAAAGSPAMAGAGNSMLQSLVGSVLPGTQAAPPAAYAPPAQMALPGQPAQMALPGQAAPQPTLPGTVLPNNSGGLTTPAVQSILGMLQS